MLRLIFSLALATNLLVLTPALVLAGENTPTITLTGIGKAEAAPDMALISSGVVSRAPTAREALDENTAAMQAVLDLANEMGVAQEDIQTSNFSIRPQYAPYDRRDSQGNPLPPEITGYEVSNMLSVRVRDLASLGPLLDRFVSAGANQINAISFSLSDPGPFEDEARRTAMADAIAKARLYAEAAGVQLGRILTITESSLGPMPQAEFMMSSRMAMESAPVPVAAGELSFSRTITVQWELVQD